MYKSQFPPKGTNPIKIRALCLKHPRYNPAVSGGERAIVGGCVYCAEVLALKKAHDAAESALRNLKIAVEDYANATRESNSVRGGS